MSNFNTIQNLFLHDKPRKKWICQVKIGEKICGTEISDCGNVSGRTRHIQRKHQSITVVKKNISSQTSQTKESESCILNQISQTAYPIGSSKYKKLNSAVLEYIILKNLPLSHADDPIFLKLLQTFDPKHNQRYCIFLDN